MAIRKIAQLGEPVLRRRAAEVPSEFLAGDRFARLLDDLVDTMRDADGAGLAAPQIYESCRVCVIEVRQSPRYPAAPAMPLTVFVNPVVVPLVKNPEAPADSDSVFVYEGCLSVQGLRGRVRRPRKVRVSALDARAQPFEMVLEGFLSAVIQHETDHLDGSLFIDKADPRTLTFVREYDRYVVPAERIVDGGAPS